MRRRGMGCRHSVALSVRDTVTLVFRLFSGSGIV